MSEKIFAFLLRLYPVRFRQRFEEEALQLFRDRLREEQGLLGRLRLGTDLLADFISGLPQAYSNTYATAARAGWPEASGPTFQSLEEEPLRPGSILLGSIVAFAALALFVFVMGHIPAYHPQWGINQRLRAASVGSLDNPDAQSVAEQLDERIRVATQVHRCFFDRVELHPGNIGYVKLSWFPDPASCLDVASAVMSRLNQTDAVIFDLRDTRGGYPEMVRRMAGWLFDHPVQWYNPRATSPAELVTLPDPESRLAHKPVFVLTSSRTFSGAEHFTYNLKLLKRATIVGETTSGASHGGAGGLPGPGALLEPKPIWEGPGVEPDVKVTADAALRTAENLALSALHKD